MQKAEGRIQNAESPVPGQQTADRLKPGHRTEDKEKELEKEKEPLPSHEKVTPQRSVG
jgi:hypothetical protein